MARAAATLMVLFLGGLLMGTVTRSPAEEPVPPQWSPPVSLEQAPDFADPLGLDAVTLGHETGCDVDPPSEFSALVERAAVEFGVDARVVSTTVWRESGCREAALGGAGEIGLMQVNPSVWRDHLAGKGITDLWSPKENLRAGAYILSYCQGRTDGLFSTFRCYNGSGPKARRYAQDQLNVFLASW